MKIYSDRAHYVGVVQDVVLDDEEGKILGLAFGSRGESVTTVPYESVMAIGDIVLVRSKRPVPEEAEEAVPERVEEAES